MSHPYGGLAQFGFSRESLTSILPTFGASPSIHLGDASWAKDMAIKSYDWAIDVFDRFLLAGYPKFPNHPELPSFRSEANVYAENGVDTSSFCVFWVVSFS